MTPLELHWLGGFLDGEGSFPRKRGVQVINATQKARELLDRVRRVVGAGRIRRFEWRGRWYWRYEVGGAVARRVMRELYPLMSRKRCEQIRRALHGSELGRGAMPAQADFKVVA